TLTKANHDFFVVIRSIPASTFTLASADPSFIHFDSTIQHWAIYFFHGRANAMAKVPCCFVADSESALNLIGRDSFTCFAKQQSRKEPLSKWKVRVIEDRGSGNTELIVTILAIEQLLRGRKFDNRSFAAQAFNTIRP